MTTPAPDFRELCAELLDELQYQTSYETNAELQDRARAALATPTPEPPTDEEILKLTENISPVHLYKHKSLPSDWDFGNYACSPKGLIDIARAVLDKWG
jgi:hypothetical protein